MIMVRTLRRDIAQYNKDDDLVSLNWKQFFISSHVSGSFQIM